jgi:hypothetical protein
MTGTVPRGIIDRPRAVEPQARRHRLTRSRGRLLHRKVPREACSSLQRRALAKLAMRENSRSLGLGDAAIRGFLQVTCQSRPRNKGPPKKRLVLQRPTHFQLKNLIFDTGPAAAFAAAKTIRHHGSFQALSAHDDRRPGRSARLRAGATEFPGMQLASTWPQAGARATHANGLRRWRPATTSWDSL